MTIKEKASHEKAKQMLIAGESYDDIIAETHLRLKDIKRIEKNEISSKF